MWILVSDFLFDSCYNEFQLTLIKKFSALLSTSNLFIKACSVSQSAINCSANFWSQSNSDFIFWSSFDFKKISF